MNCNEYENQITEYLENTASPSQRIQMESHLTECEKCRSLLEQEKSVMEQLSTIPIESCPDEIIDRVMETISVPGMSLKERIHQWFQPGLPRRYGFVSLTGFVVIVLMLLFVYIPGQQRQTLQVQKYSPEEIQQATAEAKLALAYFSVYSRKAEAKLEKIDFDKSVIKPVEGELKKAIGKIPFI
jgi:anti-sigma factor RsiW